MINECSIPKDFEGNGRGLIEVLPRDLLYGTGENHEKLQSD
jgi:hypothetical protein